MADTNDILLHQLLDRFVSGFGTTAKIPQDYREKMGLINSLRCNDYTGIVNTVLEYKIKAGSVPFTFQTPDATLRKFLQKWSEEVNKDLSIDIQRGLGSVTAQYMRERYYSSFIGIQIFWIKKDGYWVPGNIWLVDGANITVDGDTNVLGGYEYKIGGKGSALKKTSNKSVIIRKPFNSWYEQYPDPYLVKNGVLYNALMKKELLQKQGDVLEAILPYMFAIKAGSDALEKLNRLPVEGELEDLVDQVKKIKTQYSQRLNGKGTIGGFAHDVSFEHVIPDLTKFFNEAIVKPIDRNIFSSLGLVELTGFSSNREEAIMNPKMLVEEIKDAVADLTLIYEDIMMEFKEKNNLQNKEITVLPGTIKSFITDSMRVLARSAYDRGVLTRQTFAEDYLELDFETEVKRSDIERRRNLDVRMFPPVIMNQDQGNQPDTRDTNPDNVTPEQKTSQPDIKAHCNSCNFVFAVDTKNSEDLTIECPECKELMLMVDAKEDRLQAVYENIDELPDQCDVLPIGAKKIFMKIVNKAIKENKTDHEAFKLAWHTVKLSYYKDETTGKWKKIKKANDESQEVSDE